MSYAPFITACRSRPLRIAAGALVLAFGIVGFTGGAVIGLGWVFGVLG